MCKHIQGISIFNRLASRSLPTHNGILVMSQLSSRRTMAGHHQRYLDSMSKGVEGMWLKQRHTDVTLQVGGKAYSAHRVVLGAMSGYFKEFFMQERADVVTVPDIASDVFEVVLSYIYTGKSEDIRDNVYDVLKAAVFLQIGCLQELCEDSIRVRITTDTCIGIYKLSISLGCAALAKQSWSYLLEFFEKVSKGKEYLSISVDELIAIINDDDLNTSSEEVVCDAVMIWLAGDPSARIQNLEKLFGYIRFPLISPAYIGRLRNDTNVQKSASVLKILAEFGDYLKSGTTSMPVNPRQFHQRTEEMICVVGLRSRQPNPETTELKCFSFKRDSEYLLAPLPVEPGACFAVCTSSNDIYLSGGYLGQKKMLRYLPSENNWQLCTDMVEGRWGHSMVAVDGNVYIFGGSKKVPETIASVEMYDPSKDKFSIVAGLPIPVSFMAAAAIGDKIFIFGGKSENREICQKVQCFDTKSKQCTVVADMPVVESTISRAVVVDNVVFIFYNQGEVVRFDGTQPEVVGSIPKFDHFGVVAHRGQIVIDGSANNQSSTHVFDPCTMEVTPFTRTVKVALCSFYCMNIVMGKSVLQGSLR